MDRATFDALLAARRAKQPVCLATPLGGGAARLVAPGADDPLADEARAALTADKARLVDTADGAVFLNPFNPPLRLIVVGAVHIAEPLVPMAALAGYAVTVIDPRRAFARETRFAGAELIVDWPDEAMPALALDGRCAVVVLTHDPKIDDPALDATLASPAFYIGALGSGRTHAKRLDRLRSAGFDAAALERIRGPIGLAIGARTPAEIAIAILAQMTAALRGATP